MSKEKKSAGVIITAAVIALIFLAAAAASVYILGNRSAGAVAYIYSDGELVKEINLDSLAGTETFKVETPGGGYNIIEAEPGKIHVKEASCPDKVCVNMGYITGSALPISCLPNKMIIKIEGGKSEDDADIAVY